jgi:hypothetical protein
MEFSMEFSVEFHETEFDGLPWKNSMEFRGILWNFVNSWNFMEFGFDRVVVKVWRTKQKRIQPSLVYNVFTLYPVKVFRVHVKAKVLIMVMPHPDHSACEVSVSVRPTRVRKPNHDEWCEMVLLFLPVQFVNRTLCYEIM